MLTRMFTTWIKLGCFTHLFLCTPFCCQRRILVQPKARKSQKDCLTLVVCSNANGMHKIPLQLVGKPKKPACIVGKEWPLPYCAQKNAWMDTSTFMKWSDEIFCPCVRLRMRHPVLLLMDNAPSQSNEFICENVTVKFLPPNVTSWKLAHGHGYNCCTQKEI